MMPDGVEKNVSRSETVTQQKISKQLVLYSIHMQTIYTIFQTKMPKIFKVQLLWIVGQTKQAF